MCNSPPTAAPNSSSKSWSREYVSVGNLVPAVVVSVAPKTVRVYAKTRGFAQIDWDGMSWARKPGANESVGPPPERRG